MLDPPGGGGASLAIRWQRTLQCQRSKASLPRPGNGSVAPSRNRPPAQAQAWPAIASGEHVLISAPTGSGKTLAAFLWAIDTLAAERGSGGLAAASPACCARFCCARPGISLVYVSPLKALSYDIDRNLRVPLRGIGADLTVAVRSGDTPQRERQQMLRNPPDILITTPESLYLMLTGQAQKLVRAHALVHRR